MNNLKNTAWLAFSLLTTSFLYDVAFHAAPLLAAPEQNEVAATVQTNSTETAPSGLAAVQVGPLEITPARVNLLLRKESDDTYFTPTIRFKIKNTSSADIKIILFKHSIEATDEFGYAWFDQNYIKSGGIVLSDLQKNYFSKAFTDEKGSFVTISPRQIFEAQILPSSELRYKDKDSELLRAHRPKYVSFSATIGVINLDNTNDTRAFSFSDVPVQVTAR